MAVDRSTAPVSIGRALREIPLGLVLALAAALAALIVGYRVAGAAGFPPSALTRDPAAISKQPFYHGFFSNLGIVLWSATAGLVVGGLALRARGEVRRAAFLLWFGAVTAILALDDVFMVHEEVYGLLLPGPSEVPVLVYAVLAAGGLFVFRDVIVRTSWLPLLVALGGFGASLSIDAAVSRPSADAMFVEDAAKLLGIVAWTWYFGAETLRALRERG